MPFKELYACPKCRQAVCKEKEEYFACPKCGSAICREEELSGYGGNYCGRCGHEIADVIKEAIKICSEKAAEAKKVLFKEFYSCPRCREAAQDKKKYFICPHCRTATKQLEELECADDKYCIKCGHEVASAIKEALALAQEKN